MHWIAPAIAVFFFLVPATPAQTSGSSTLGFVRPLTTVRAVAWCEDAFGNRLPNRTATLSNGCRPYAAFASVIPPIAIGGGKDGFQP